MENRDKDPSKEELMEGANGILMFMVKLKELQVEMLMIEKCFKNHTDEELPSKAFARAFAYCKAVGAMLVEQMDNIKLDNKENRFEDSNNA